MDEQQKSFQRQDGTVDEQLVSTITQTVLKTLQETGVVPQSGRSGAAQQENERTIDLIGLFLYLIERVWLIVICAIIGAVVMGYTAVKTIPTYTATAKLYIVNPDSGGINIANLQLGSILTMDYQEVFRTWEVHQMVIEELDLPMTYEQMQGLVTVTNPEDTHLLYISATHPDSEMAAKIANAYANAGKKFIINNMRGEEPSDFSIALEPSFARIVSTPNRTMIGFLGGTVLAAGLLTLIFVLDFRPRSPADVEMYGGIPTLAVFPLLSKKLKNTARKGLVEPEGGWMGPLLSIERSPELDFMSLEAMNSLCTSLSYCGKDIRKILITSRYASEGKSHVTMNLMHTLARLGRTVVLVDTDLRASTMRAKYQLHPNTEHFYGLSEYLSGMCGLNEILYQSNVRNAYMIPCGHEAPNPLELLDTEAMRELIEWLGTQFDVVLLDTPPVGLLADAIAMAKFCDGALLVVGYRKGRNQEIGEVVQQIKQTDCRVLGAVLNGVKFHNLSNKHYYYNSERYSGHYSNKYYRRYRKTKR